VIRSTRDENYSKFRSREYVEDEITLLYETYMFNVVEECENIYIKIRNYLDGEQLTFDAKTIIPNLSVPLGDKEWEKLKNMK